MSFEKGEVVWAKIKGFPWWPGVVSKKTEEKGATGTSIEYLINFIGDNTHAKLAADKVAKYRENFDLYFKPGHKKLMSSIKEAEEICPDKITLEEHRARLHDNKEDATVATFLFAESFYMIWLLSRVEERNLQRRSSLHKSTTRAKTGVTSTSVALMTLYNLDSSGGESGNESEQEATKSASVSVVKQKKRGRKPTKQTKQKGAVANARGKSKQNSFRRKMPIRPHSSSEKETFELKPRRNLMQHTIAHLDSPYDTNLPLNHENYSVSESQSVKHMGVVPLDNINMMSIENMTIVNDYRSSTKDVLTEAGPHDKLNSITEAPEATNTPGAFLQKSSKIKKSIKVLEEQLADYTSSSSTAGNALAATIQECLNELSVESLSSEELLSYLHYDLGKLLYTLSSVLYEFEKFALENSITVHPMIKQKREKVSNLLSTLKIRLISNFLEHQEYVKSHTEDLRERLRDRKEEEKKKEERLRDINASLERTLNNLEIRTVKVEFNDEEYALKNAGADRMPAVNEPPIKNFEQFKFDGNRSKSGQSTDVIKSRKEPSVSTQDESLKAVNSQDTPTRADGISKHVTNPELRKKVCQKLAKYIEEIYDLKKDVAREKTMIIENKIRMSSPEMKDEYKSRSIMVMQLMKFKLIILDEVTDKNNIDWTLLKAKLDKFNSQQKDKAVSDKLLSNEEFSPATEKTNPPKRPSTRSNTKLGPNDLEGF